MHLKCKNFNFLKTSAHYSIVASHEIDLNVFHQVIGLRYVGVKRERKY